MNCDKHSYELKTIIDLTGSEQNKIPRCKVCGIYAEADEVAEVKGTFGMMLFYVNGIEYKSRRSAIEAAKHVFQIPTRKAKTNITWVDKQYDERVGGPDENATKSKIPDNPLRYGVAEERQEPCSLPDAWYIESTPEARALFFKLAGYPASDQWLCCRPVDSTACCYVAWRDEDTAKEFNRQKITIEQLRAIVEKHKL